MTTKITLDNIAPSAISTLSSVKITSIGYVGATTAANTAGGETITVTGSGFASNIIAYINSTICTTAYINSTSLTFTTPNISAGFYNTTLYNIDGSSTTKPGIIFSQPPVWVTSAGALSTATRNESHSQSVNATGTSITYSITSGSLPEGLSLNSTSGEITGTPTASGISNFTVTATNNYNQTTNRSFSIEVISVALTSYLLVGGGGSGGTGYYGGGGGAGGFVESNVTLALDTTYTITIGTGGVGTTTQTNRGGNGGNTSISGAGITTITALGGGGGGSRNGDATGPVTSSANGADGGSGGGVGFSYPGTTVPGSAKGGEGLQPSSLSGGYGNKGAGQKDPALGYRLDGGGGGGAGASAANGPAADDATIGGIGRQSSIKGTATYYAGGGGGGYLTGSGGLGGGGNKNTAGTTNTGGGGGGAPSNNGQGAAGGSGVAILKYANTFAAANTTGTPNVIVTGGFRIYTFTGTGTFVIN